MSEFQETDFYTFFNLHEINTTKSSSSCILYKTGGFQEYVTIEIHVDEQENIDEVIIVLDREWIGNFKTINPFGKDIAKSFIGTFIPPTVKSEFRESLITSLWNMKGTEDVVICMDRVVTTWESYNLEVRDFLDVYRGLKNEARKILDGYELIMANINEDNKKMLKILIGNMKR